MPGGLSPARDGRGFLVGEIARFDSDYPIFGQAFVFGMATEIDVEGGCKNCLPTSKAGYFPPDGFNVPGKFHAKDVTSGLVPSQDQATQDFLPSMNRQVEAAHDRVTNGDSSGMDFNQYFVISRRRFGYIHQL